MKKILMVEDDQIISTLYRNKLTVEGFQVEMAADGQIAIDLLKRFQPDVVILDLMLPKVNGVEVLKFLRAQPATKNVPVVVFTNAYMINLVQEAWKAGATKCIIKADCTPKQLIDIVRAVANSVTPVAAVEAPAPVPPQPVPGAPSPARAPPAPAPGYSPVALPAAAPQPAPSAASALARPSSALVRPEPAPAGNERAPAAINGDTDSAFQAELRKSFFDSAPQNLTLMRSLLQAFVKTEGDTTRQPLLLELYRKVHSLAGNAAMANTTTLARMATALEALIKEMHDKPKNVNASTTRTVAQCIDFLGVLLDRAGAEESTSIMPVNILVVDDEILSRRAVVHSLEKAGLKSISIDDPLLAFKLLAENAFDLVILDIEMPGMDGFELCTKLRGLPAHKKTPVIFVTGLGDFESRAKSTLSGGNDLIAKPFLFIELAVKALIYILRQQAPAPVTSGGVLTKP